VTQTRSGLQSTMQSRRSFPTVCPDFLSEIIFENSLLQRHRCSPVSGVSRSDWKPVPLLPQGRKSYKEHKHTTSLVFCPKSLGSRVPLLQTRANLAQFGVIDLSSTDLEEYDLKCASRKFGNIANADVTTTILSRVIRPSPPV
jgi:hypothetical protein